MCKPSCCNNDSGGSAFPVLAVVVVLAAIVVIEKVAHAVSHGVSVAAHVAAEVLYVVIVVTMSAIVLAVAAGLIVVAVRLWRRHGRGLRLPRRPVRRLRARVLPVARAGCLSCGGSGRVLAPSRSGVLALAACRVCAPALADPGPAGGVEVASCAR
jgi:hypothetical protein